MIYDIVCSKQVLGVETNKLRWGGETEGVVRNFR